MSVTRYRIINVDPPPQKRVRVTTPSGPMPAWRSDLEAVTREMTIDETFEILQEDADAAARDA